MSNCNLPVTSALGSFLFIAEIVQDSDEEQHNAINFDPSLPTQHQVLVRLLFIHSETYE